MEQFLDVIVDIEVIDKRETGGVSANKEVTGLKRLLVKVVTDASTAVMALVRRMKNKYKHVNLLKNYHNVSFIYWEITNFRSC